MSDRRFEAPEHIRAIRTYPTGTPVDRLRRELGVERILQLAANENTAGPPPEAIEAAHSALGTSGFYPDGPGIELREAIAERHGVEPTQVILGSGSGEIVDLLCRAFLVDGEAIAMARYGFVQYRLSAQLVNARVLEAEPDAELRDDPVALAERSREARIVFIANPNNPTGTMLSAAELDAYFARVDDELTLTVVDQAYQEYVDPSVYPDSLARLAAGRNVMILGTFSKIYALAALRIGYGIAAPEIIDRLDRARLPYNTSTHAQAAALAALSADAHVEATRERNRTERTFLTAELGRRGLAVTPSSANFLLVDFGRPSGEVAAALRRKAILVLPTEGLGLAGRQRITVGLREENEILLDVIDRLGLSG